MVKHINFDDRYFEPSFTTTNTIVLNFRENALKEVIVTAEKPLKVKGDTLSYSVSQWQNNKDSSIEDVLKRIPGVEVNDEGYISHNGKFINHLYINGVDLLENRYTIATKGLPAGVIDDIEVLQNHSHKKVNKGTTKAKGVSINLSTKNANIFTGITDLAVANPFLSGSISTTPIFINPEYQVVGSLKATDLGDDLVFKDRSISIFKLNTPQPELDYIDLINENRNQQTNLDRKYWRDTHTGNTTIDFITVDENKRNYKIGYSTDYDEVFLGNSFRETIQLNDRLIENIESNNYFNISRNHYLKGYYEDNKDNNYLKVDLYAKSSHDNQSSRTLLNTNRFDSEMVKDGQTIFASFQNNIKTKSNLWSLDGLVQYTNTNDEFGIVPEVFDVLNSTSDEYSYQTIATEQLLLNFNAGYFKQLKKGHIDVVAGWDYRKQMLESGLDQSNSTDYQIVPFQNSQDYNFNNFSVKSILQQEYGSTRLTVTGKLSYNNVNSTDSQDTNDQINKVFFEPNLNINQRFNSKWSTYGSASISNSIADLNRFQTSFLITDYNRNSRFENNIQRSRNYNFGSGWNYKNILKGFFFNGSATYGITENTQTLALDFDDNGFRILNFIDQPTQNTFFNLRSDISQTVGQKINLKLSGSYNSQRLETFFNNDFTNLRIDNYQVNLKGNYDPISWYYVNTDFGFFNNKSFNDGSALNSYSYSAQVIFGQEVFENHYTEFTWNGQRNIFGANDNSNNLFDFRYIFKSEKNYELNFKAINLLNQKNYTVVSNDSNITSVSSFPLIGRQFIVSYQFYF
ncbi:TonB-dependent receptor [Nonlabens antarcticus]|uniref:hypothetical protein n=1 Tax=Nonlabens antarcticus TaxID=392714 RepID=UPI0018918495|nr:hypothetical protein [Nonlabens antarcticus]